MDDNLLHSNAYNIFQEQIEGKRKQRLKHVRQGG